MRKFRLELEALQVDSFDTTAASRAERGTVRGHAGAFEEDVAIITDPRTRDASCFGTCKISCWGTCLVSCLGTCEVSCDNKCTDLCTYGCSDGCTAYTCPSGGEICCA